MSHLTTTGGFIILATRKENKGAHLEVIDGQRLFVVESLVEDFHKACQTLILHLANGELKQKQMVMNEISL
jgi:hypothetical protein